MTVKEFKNKYPVWYKTEWKFKESYKYSFTYEGGGTELIFTGDIYRDCFVPVETISKRQGYTEDIEVREDKIIVNIS